MDGVTLSVIRCELEGYLPLRVQKVQQPGKKELVFSVWSPSVRERLVVSLEGPEPFFGFSDERKENPAVPPGFCLGLRKRLEGGTLVSVRQEGLDRVLYLDFDGHDDFGGKKRFVLVFDMAGREQNIGLFGEGLLISSIIPSDEGRFEHRSQYIPPAGDRLDLRQHAGEEGKMEIARALWAGQGTLGAAVGGTVEGVGKEMAKGLLAWGGLNEIDPVTEAGTAAVAGVLSQVGVALAACAGRHVTAVEDKSAPDDTYRDGDKSGGYGIRPAIYISPKGLVLHAFPLPHLDLDAEFDTMLDAAKAYRERATMARDFESQTSAADALHRKVLKKVQSRHEAQVKDLTNSQDFDKFRVWAQLIDQSGQRNPPGATEVTVTDYYQDPPRETVVPLDPRKSVRDNARAYYQTYAKHVRGQRVLQESVSKLGADLRALTAAREALDRALDVSDVRAAILPVEALARREGIAVKSARLPRAGQASPGAISIAGTVPSERAVPGPDGAVFLVGGSAKQNDALVTRFRRPGDVWLHAKGVTGAHIIARPPLGGQLSEAALLAAARLAAQKSGAKGSPKAEVDYIDAMKVRKPRGGAPGFVTYTGQKSLMVDLEV